MDDVVGGGVYVELDVLVVVGGGGVYVVVGVVEVGCEAPEPISQSPEMTPASRDEKYWNKSWDISRPPYPHPGHCGITK